MPHVTFCTTGLGVTHACREYESLTIVPSTSATSPFSSPPLTILSTLSFSPPFSNPSVLLPSPFPPLLLLPQFTYLPSPSPPPSLLPTPCPPPLPYHITLPPSPPSALDLSSHMDDEYAWAGVEDPKVVITTSHSPSSRLKQFAKVESQ